MITLREALNTSEVENILLDDEIFERIAEDGQDKESFSLPFDVHHLYIMIVDEKTPIGVWCIYPANGVTLNIHCNILKKYRNSAVEAGKLIMEWFVHDSPAQYQKLNCEIPIIYRDVYQFTKKFGFKNEGENRRSIMKKGRLVDQWRLGITRDEARGLYGVR